MLKSRRINRKDTAWGMIIVQNSKRDKIWFKAIKWKFKQKISPMISFNKNNKSNNDNRFKVFD